MSTSPFRRLLVPVALATLAIPPLSAQALTVTQTTDGSSLLGALVGNPAQFDALSATYTQGDAAQIGTYSGFSAPPVTFGNGIVMSTGRAVDVVGPALPDNPPNSGLAQPSTDFGNGSTAAIDNYAPGAVTNWSASFDAAVLTVNFTLADPSAIAFSFVFGSVEYPVWTSNFTDAVYVFLDHNQQITFDPTNHAVQVGESFASLLTTADQNTVFADPHGLLKPLVTTSGLLSAGDHTLEFEIADTNDGILDSAIFISNLRTTAPRPGGDPITEPEDGNDGHHTVIEPASLGLFGTGLLGVGFVRRRVRRA